MDEVILEILKIEWDMMQAVENLGGRSPCQDNYNGFAGARSSQFLAWNSTVRKKYLKCLKEARKAGRNLVYEKYLYMMQETMPDAFESLTEDQFNPPATVKALADSITAHMVAQAEYCEKGYPGLLGQGRPIRSGKADRQVTTIENYQRCELYTYSEETLLALETQLQLEGDASGCMAERILENTIKAAGFESLEAAEAAIQKQQGF